jgi:hypothetical protein
MKITIPKILAGGVGLFSLMFVFALVRVETSETRQTAAMHEVKKAITEVINVVEVPEATKIWALKRGYQLNGNSMVGPTIDLTKESPDTKVIETIVVKPDELNEIDRAMPVEKIQAQTPVETNVCTRHGMKKVVKGDSWHCRRL